MHPMRGACARQRRALKRGLRSIDAYAFFDLLTNPSMLGEVESHLPVHRERLLPPTETLAMFLAQALSADRSCQHAVDSFVARRGRRTFGVQHVDARVLPRALAASGIHGGFVASLHGEASERGGAAQLDLAGTSGAVGRWVVGVFARYGGQPGRLPQPSSQKPSLVKRGRVKRGRA